MDVMSIAATSISLSQMQTAQAVSVAVTRKAMDQMTQQAAAIVEEAVKRNLALASVSGFTAVHGRGVRAALEGEQYLGGNLPMLEEAGIDPRALRQRAEELAAQGVYHGILPSAGATLNAAHLLLR